MAESELDAVKRVLAESRQVLIDATEISNHAKAEMAHCDHLLRDIREYLYGRIAEIVGDKVTLTKTSSGTLIGLCPFHDEHTPSFHVSPREGIFHCFGCGASGNAEAFVRLWRERGGKA